MTTLTITSEFWWFILWNLSSDDNPIYKTYKESIEEDDFYDEEILYKPKNVKDVENAESGNFKCGEFQGWGEDDQIDKMFFPEWRT